MDDLAIRCKARGRRERPEAAVPFPFAAWLPPILVAPFIGSFLGVLIRRLPAGRPVAFGRSHCESCGHTLAPLEMIPVLSFAVQRGRCRSCGARIAPEHLAVELAATGIAVWAASVEADPDRLWAGCVLGWALLALGWIDWEHFRLPDAITLPLILAGLAATALLTPWDNAGHALGAAAGYLAIRALDLAYRAWRGRSGIGQGDAKLLAAAGAWLGWDALPTVVTAAAITGLAVALAMRLRGQPIGGQTALPFGPCLALATWLVWLYPLVP
jgi:leader peptidase (prepilin peptidase)/N-methyltransferase